MKYALWLIGATASGLVLLYLGFGYQVAYQLGYGMLTAMAVMISFTFAWLYAKKLTPLALGMAVSWLGAALVMGWWWVFSWTGSPDWMRQSPLLLGFLSFYLVGAGFHFLSIERAFDWRQGSTIWGLALALVISGLAFFA